MPRWHQSPKLTPRYFLETSRLFGYPINWLFNINVNLKMYSFDHLRMYNIDHINTFCSRW